MSFNSDVLTWNVSWQELGINAIELMPCHEFNELEYYSYNSIMGDYK